MPPHYSTGNPVHDMQSVLRDSGCIPIDCPDDVSWAIAAPQHRAGRKPSHVSLSRPCGLPSAIAAFRDDLLDVIADVRAAPYSHALVAFLAFIGGLLLVIVPAMIGAGILS